mmetsp:Transcript_4651/g.12241  ORF Transcript_4651/g.12241 Transcript_4651/m.12241 type:complete len:86 (+) Transcript_4651:285-542(+)
MPPPSQPMRHRVHPAQEMENVVLKGKPSSTVMISLPFWSTRSPESLSVYPPDLRDEPRTVARKRGDGIETVLPATSYLTEGSRIS